MVTYPTLAAPLTTQDSFPEISANSVAQQESRFELEAGPRSRSHRAHPLPSASAELGPGERRTAAVKASSPGAEPFLRCETLQ